MSCCTFFEEKSQLFFLIVFPYLRTNEFCHYFSTYATKVFYQTYACCNMTAIKGKQHYRWTETYVYCACLHLTIRFFSLSSFDFRRYFLIWNSAIVWLLCDSSTPLKKITTFFLSPFFFLVFMILHFQSLNLLK